MHPKLSPHSRITSGRRCQTSSPIRWLIAAVSTQATANIPQTWPSWRSIGVREGPPRKRWNQIVAIRMS